MTTDLTFFTNEPDAALLVRFRATLRDVQFFEVLAGYFAPADSMCGLTTKPGATGDAMGARVECAGV